MNTSNTRPEHESSYLPNPYPAFKPKKQEFFQCYFEGLPFPCKKCNTVNFLNCVDGIADTSYAYEIIKFIECKKCNNPMTIVIDILNTDDILGYTITEDTMKTVYRFTLTKNTRVDFKKMAKFMTKSQK